MGVYSDLADNITPPRDDNGMVLTTSTTARSYSLEKLSAGAGTTPDVLTANATRVYMRVHAVSQDLYVQLKSTKAVTLDRTYAQAEASAEGEAPVISNKFGELIPAGQSQDFTLNRGKDRFLHLQAAGAGTARVRFSSEPFSGR